MVCKFIILGAPAAGGADDEEEVASFAFVEANTVVRCRDIIREEEDRYWEDHPATKLFLLQLHMMRKVTIRRKELI
jgi:hypothetical protein